MPRFVQLDIFLWRIRRGMKTTEICTDFTENSSTAKNGSTCDSKVLAFTEDSKRFTTKQALGVIDTEEEDRWTLDELGIDFPNEWASSEFLEGRNW